MLADCKAVFPSNIVRWIQLRKTRARVRAYGSRPLCDVLTRIEGTADLNRIRALDRRMKPLLKAEPTSAAKYVDYGFWLWLNAERAGRAGLHASGPLRILDLGCGPGYFMAVARALGHDCSGADVPEAYFTPAEREVYEELLTAMHCNSHRTSLLVERFVPLPMRNEEYDLITAFWICFNRHRQSDEWGCEEWRFFVEDALRCLRNNGRLYLELNEHDERYGDLRWYDAATLAYFRSVGTVESGRVIIARR